MATIQSTLSNSSVSPKSFASAARLQSSNIVDDVKELILDAGKILDDLASIGTSFTDVISNYDDWRARLSLANSLAFTLSPVFKPLKDAGGLVFPYTPTITTSSKANYQKQSTTHTNFAYHSYSNSEVSSIQITAPMNVEDQEQGLYWLAALHYLRSLTKMFTSENSLNPGNPPPIIFFNAYGNHVFKNIPVVVTDFGVTLDKDCDYISVSPPQGGIPEGINLILKGVETFEELGSLYEEFTAGLTGESAYDAVIGALSSVMELAGSVTISGKDAKAYIPAKSTFTVTLQPIYSKTTSRRFSLDVFASGGYLYNYYGFI